MSPASIPKATTPPNPPAAPSPVRADDQGLTPAMRQYWEHKRQAGDALLLFRMGDFYELFYDDATLASRVLGIALTSRDGGKTPLAGIPHHALESYLARLVAAGYKVAISEQVEDARQAKGVVKRGLVRIVTPGTLTDDGLLDESRRNILAAVCEQPDDCGLAWLELSTGEFSVQACDRRRLLDELFRIGPAEVLLADSATFGPGRLEAEIRQKTATAVTYCSASDFGAHRAEQLLCEHFQTRGLAGFGFERIDASLQAAGALLAYLRRTQMSAIAHLRPPRRCADRDYVVLDPTTLRSLEIERTLRAGTRAGSLLAAVDQTCNPMGARLLRQWLCYPLRDLEQIRGRQQIVEALRHDEARRSALRRLLREAGDIERLIGRLGLQRATPRDLRALGDGLSRLVPMRGLLRETGALELAPLTDVLEGLDELAQRLCESLRPDAPHVLREGGIFADGILAELDRLRALGSDAQRWLADFQAREAARTGIGSLKVGYNKVFGFYIEISNAHRQRVPPDYVRKQTVKNAERYVTDELKRHESEVLSAQTRACELEYEQFEALRREIATSIPAMQRAAATLAALDVLTGWAELSARRRYSRPEFVEEGLVEIEAGRHPVVEQTLGEAFVPNDTRLCAASDSFALITGPNMSGKSTYIRQVALLVLLAHCGCWVPAKRMRLGAVDRIFTRVGAADDLSGGQSTFMVEMLEAANILHNATPDSLVILDEIGRGTSTYDGLALAWAITEQLATRCGCRTLFATHYHELTELAELLEPVFNLNVAVREYEDQVVFLHRIVPGAAARSYGLHVAKLAGIPREVLERANAVLNELERNFARESQRPVLAAVQRRRQRQLRLFEEPEEAVVRELRDLSLETTDGTAALAWIRRWRGQLDRPPPAPGSGV